MNIWSKQIKLAIVGAEKAGTTSLFRQLAKATEFTAHQQREIGFFISDFEFKKGEKYLFNKYFPNIEGKFFLAKDVRLMNYEEGLLRLKKTSPDVKIIVMLREPASRAYSSYQYSKLRGLEDAKTFEDALEIENYRFEKDSWKYRANLYKRNSTYAPKVSRLFDIFGRCNVLVLYLDDYKKSSISCLKQIERLVDIPLLGNIESQVEVHNSAARPRSVKAAKIIAKILSADNIIKRLIRSIIPHSLAVKIRHGILNLNRIEAPYEPINPNTANIIREELSDDAEQLFQLLGRCPWRKDAS